MSDLTKFLMAIYEKNGLYPMVIVALLFCFGALAWGFLKILRQVMFDMQNLTKTIQRLTDKVSSPYLSTEQSIVLFRETIKSDIENKLKFVGNILTSNNLKRRSLEITTNIKSEFHRFTNSKAEKLAMFRTSSGDLGKILTENTDWTNMMSDIIKIVFSDFNETQKITDIRTRLNFEADKLVKIIENRGLAN